MRFCLEGSLKSKDFYTFEKKSLFYRGIPIENCGRKVKDAIICKEIRKEKMEYLLEERVSLCDKLHCLSQKDLNLFCFSFRSNNELHKYIKNHQTEQY